MKELVIPIKGMHCHSCELMIADKLEDLQNVRRANVSLKTKTATIYAPHLPPQRAIRRAITSAGYEIGYDEKPLLNKSRSVYKDLLVGIGLVIILGIFFKLSGITDLSNINLKGANASVIALVIGLTAGFSTCMALIGGLVLGLSARHAEKHPSATPMEKFRPHLYFNTGRILSFVAFGALIGALGSFLQLKGSLLGMLTIAVGIFMLMIGLQLTELFPRLGGGLSLPSGLAKLFRVKHHSEKEYSHKNSMLLGGVTFFLPCGFTQAMQLFAISTGSAVTGAIIMGAFAIGTAPGLLSIGGLTSVVKGTFARRFFRVVGVAVVAMAFLNITNGYNLLSLRLSNPFGNTGQQASAPQTESSKPGSANSTETLLPTTYTLDRDIVPNSFSAKVGEKTVIEVDVKEDGQGCMSTIMIPGLVNDPQFLKSGKKIKMAFTAQKTGKYQVTCAMGVPRGTLTVI